MVPKLLVTGDPSFVKSQIQKIPRYMALVSADEAWVIHFTGEEDHLPIWQSNVDSAKGVVVVHFAHDSNFANVLMSAR
jgi:hypothetical protein